MRVPMSWLAELVDGLPDVRVVAEKLTMSGLEAEPESSDVSGMATELVVARIDALEKHPDADRLSLCTVNDGSGTRPVVCGASNMKAGDTVVLARPGAKLPGGLKIKKAKLRGVPSEGMLCAAREIGLPDAEDGIMILPEGLEVGTSAVTLLGLDDPALEISVTPNRGDCLSVRGVARELATVLGLKTTEAFDRLPTTPAQGGPVPIRIDYTEGCSLYRGIEVRGLKVQPSPLWMQTRLAAAGMRPINNLVDVTNYVLLELGQPLHAFDLDLLAGPAIHVRAAKQDETIETLDGTEASLHAGDILICDETGPVALAGVMGGLRTAVQDTTTNVFLESAVFHPSRIRAAARRLGLLTESSYRFERGIDASLTETAMMRAAELLVETGGGEIASAASGDGDVPGTRDAIRLRTRRVARVLGMDVTTDRCAEILRRLGAEVSVESEEDGGTLAVVPPAHRNDVAIEADLLEEVARIEGYDQLPVELPPMDVSVRSVPAMFRGRRLVRESLVADGLSESIGLSIADEDANAAFPGLHEATCESVRVINPLRSEEDQLRRSPLSSLARACQTNLRAGLRRVDLFTVGRGFANAGGPVHREVAAGLMTGPRKGRGGPGTDGPVSFFDAKAVVLKAISALAPRLEVTFVPVGDRTEYHPRAAAGLTNDGAPLGYMGKIHPFVAEALDIPEETYIFELDLDALVPYSSHPHPGMAGVPRYPGSARDVSLLVGSGVLAGDVLAAVGGVDCPEIADVSVFDEYIGDGMDPGQRALAFSVLYRSPDRTLTDEEVSGLHEKVLAHVTGALDVEIRG